MSLKWGIVSAGNISHDFVSSLTVLPKTDHEVVAIAARSSSNAEQFAKKHDIKKYYQGYERLATDPDIDIVYVGNLNSQHYEVTKLMLENGKHVLCEKPLTLNEKHTRLLIDLAQSRKLLLAEGVWSRSFPAYRRLRELIDSGSIGDILHVNVSFGCNLQHVERLKSKAMGGGTILDLGVYTLQFLQFVYKGLKPDQIVAKGFLNNEGTDDAVSAIFTYSGKRIGIISTSAQVILPNEGVIVGTKGVIRVPDFWCPNKLITPDGELKFEFPKCSATFNFTKSVGLSYQAEHIRQCINQGKVESDNITHEETLQLAQFMDILRKQVGVSFQDDL